jgi:peroxiredoxin
MPKIQVNQPAPDFTLSDFNGQRINLSEFRDKANVLLVLNRGFM